MELWAESYINKAVMQKDWGDWDEFVTQMDHTFINRNEIHRAMEWLENQKQGRDSASVYFPKIKQLAALAGMDISEDPQAILQCEQGLEDDLIDKIYAGGLILNMYHVYKE